MPGNLKDRKKFKKNNNNSQTNGDRKMPFAQEK